VAGLEFFGSKAVVLTTSNALVKFERGKGRALVRLLLWWVSLLFVLIGGGLYEDKGHFRPTGGRLKQTLIDCFLMEGKLTRPSKTVYRFY